VTVHVSPVYSRIWYQNVRAKRMVAGGTKATVTEISGSYLLSDLEMESKEEGS
jgi:hypothetical protein